jgi:hypothetical protein
MRKNLIAMSVATLTGLGLAGGAAANVLQDNGGATISATNATAETVIAGGIGHQLIVPYYNTQGGNATLFNVVNTDTVNGKAVKVRFRGASNSDDVFDFQLYLSPGDVWAANISRGADGRSFLTTSDKSCTIPQVVTGKAFVTERLPQSFTVENLASQTREGYIEIFNMADIPPFAINTANGAALGTANALYTTIKHAGASSTPPCFSTPAGAAALGALEFDPANLAAAYGLGFRAPSTGLFANYTIINVQKSGAASGEATAIAATVGVGGPNGRGNIVFFPQTGANAATPDLFTADPTLRTVFGAGATDVQNGSGAPFVSTGGGAPILTASQFDLPDLSTPYLLLGAYPPVAADPITQAEALTRALATTNVINEFLGDTAITANTDWVFSLPTRRYSVALDYRPMLLNPAGAPVRAFTKFVNRDYFTGANTAVANTQICVTTAGVTYYDREENTAQGNGFVISPNPPTPGFRLCGEASVLGFNAVAGASVLGAEVAFTNFSTTGGITARDGWANVATPGLTTGLAASVGGNGLPILGKSFIRASNPAVGAGLAANFGVSYEHRYIRPVTP